MIVDRINQTNLQSQQHQVLLHKPQTVGQYHFQQQQTQIEQPKQQVQQKHSQNLQHLHLHHQNLQEHAQQLCNPQESTPYRHYDRLNITGQLVRENTHPLISQPSQQINPFPLSEDISISPGYPNPIYGSYLLYLLQYCPPQVKTCYGCSQQLKPGGFIRNSPYDLVIVSNTLRGYYDNEGTLKQRPGNVYYHVNTGCIRSKQSHFAATLVHVPYRIKLRLKNEHEIFLREFGIIF